jgi:DNA polymerase-3 subunit gamma/tau
MSTKIRTGGFFLYLALYRKWRPQVFEDVAGQPHITNTLKSEIEEGRIGHAYIFTGSRGTGKTTCAKIFAKAVNCLNPRNGDPCNECESCRGIDSASILDVVEIDAASNNGVDNIRDLREEANFTPASAKYRVFIIDEAHMLSNGAFNALLKTLEEPPSYVIFILATTQVHKIPATILSRCQRFDFHRIPTVDIMNRLLYVSEQEGIEIDNDAAMLIARLSDGGLRDALSLLDQCVGLNGRITEATVSDAAGLTGREYLFQLANAIKVSDTKTALVIIDSLYSASKDCERLCEELLLHFRNILLLKTAGKAEEILKMPHDEMTKLEENAKGFSSEVVLHVMDCLQQTLERLHKSSSVRVELEMCLLRLCVPELDNSNAALLRRISIVEDKLKSGAAVSSMSAVQPVKFERTSINNYKNDIHENSGQAGSPQTDAQQTEQIQSAEQGTPLVCWPEILLVLQKSDPPLCGALGSSSAVLIGSRVTIDTTNSLFSSLIKQAGHQKALVDAVRKITGEPYRVAVSKKSLVTETPKSDPMDEIASNAKAAGINVNEK